VTAMSHKPICWTRDAKYVHQHPLMDIHVQGRAMCATEGVAWSQEGRFRAASCQPKVIEEISETKRDKADGKVGIVGYEINFNRYFCTYEPPRPLEKIEADIRKLEGEIMEMLREVAG